MHAIPSCKGLDIYILAYAYQLKANASKGSPSEEYALHMYGVGGGCKGVGPGDLAALEGGQTIDVWSSPGLRT